jgi:hypothetical protein
VETQPEPDTKDWTWVLERPCAECGFDSRVPAREELALLSGDVGRMWIDALAAAEDPRTRPTPATWSPLEYACHVRDVFALACVRLRLMLDEDAPRFANWDQDATAIEDDYASQDPTRVSAELSAEADAFAALVAGVPDGAWQRTGLRGDGAAFTVESFTRYLLHDPIHHLTDVTGRTWTSSST